MRYLPLLLTLLLCTCAPAPPEASPTTDSPATEPAAPFQDLEPIDFAERMGEPNTVLLDVRTPAEIAKGKIEGAVELNFRDPDFAARIRELDTTKTYLVYCASGGRSSRSCEIMANAGFAKLYNLKGGYSAWSQ